MYFILENTVC